MAETDDKTVAIRLLVRRRVNQVEVKTADAELSRRADFRTARGNISLQQGRVQTYEGLDRLRERRRAKLAAEQS